MVLWNNNINEMLIIEIVCVVLSGVVAQRYNNRVKKTSGDRTFLSAGGVHVYLTQLISLGPLSSSILSCTQIK